MQLRIEVGMQLILLLLIISNNDKRQHLPLDFGKSGVEVPEIVPGFLASGDDDSIYENRFAICSVPFLKRDCFPFFLRAWERLACGKRVSYVSDDMGVEQGLA